MTEHGWCSLRLRFEEREIQLLRGAELLRGTAMTYGARSDTLRNALNLAKAGQKVSRAAPGSMVSLDEVELGLVIEALEFAAKEVPFAGRRDNDPEAGRRDAVIAAFPELVEKGTWRSFGLARELEGLAARLQAALKG